MPIIIQQGALSRLSSYKASGGQCASGRSSTGKADSVHSSACRNLEPAAQLHHPLIFDKVAPTTPMRLRKPRDQD